MKKIFIKLMLVLPMSLAYGQVGLGTQSPANSSVMDITSTNKGVLIPRVALSSTQDKAPLSGNIPTGTMVFNTVNAGTGVYSVIPSVYAWNGAEWVFPAAIGKTKYEVIKFSNSPASSINFNPISVASPVGIDIFNTVVLNSDTSGSIYEKIGDYQLRIKQDGLYLISANLALKQSPAVEDSRLSDYIYFNLDGVLASAKVITLVPQYDPSDINIGGRFAFGSNSYINAKAGQILTMHSARYKDGNNYNGTVNYDTTSLSSVTVIKIN
ncbi:hypothetical protein [Chryseobacterium sp. CT-SW4]|uniref:hypothetical protein n=1 Tax=Chryseobacterium sp. SW-1 TaxID=3157343 RepID=UPI003B028F97